MKKYKYGRYVFCLGVACLLVISMVCLTGKARLATADAEIPVSRVKASFLIDVDNQRELVGSADYVFVGKVLENAGCDYQQAFTVTSPYTNYVVQVLENIKGNLVMDTGIPIVKDGGLSEDGSCYVLYEKDELPVEEEVYIFYAFAQEDGSLLLSGPNSNRKVDGDNYRESSNYKEAVDASNNPAFIDRVRFSSIYESGNP